MPASRPPISPAGRTVRRLAIAGVVLLLAVVLAVAVVLARSVDGNEAARRSNIPAPPVRATPAPTTAASSASPTSSRTRPTATTAPNTPHPALHDRALEPRTPMGSNLMYTMLAPQAGRCEADLLSPPITTDPHDGLQALANCLTATYQDSYRAAMGVSLPAPRVETINQATETPCGVAIYNGFYCSVNKTIYIRIDALQAGGKMAGSRIASLFMVSHEFGHHLQHMSGIWEQFSGYYGASVDEPVRQVLRRRLELQADCFSGMAFRSYRDNYAIGPADHAAMRAMRTGLADADHGQADLQDYWEQAGFEFGDFGLCNTWEVGDDLVR